MALAFSATVLKSAIIVAGASSGLGAAVAEALSGPQRVLGLVDRNRAELERVAAVCQAKGAQCIVGAIDVLDRERMAQFVADFSQHHAIDLLVANGGLVWGQHASHTIESQQEASLILRSNLLSTVELVHTVVPHMLRRRQGSILITASLAGLIPLPLAPAWSASQAGLVLFGLALRDAVEPQGIRVVVACPGVRTTPRNEHGAGRPEGLMPIIASRVLKGLDRNRSLIGFPAPLFWLGRGYLLMPQFLRRRVIKLFTNYMS